MLNYWRAECVVDGKRVKIPCIKEVYDWKMKGKKI